MSVLFGEWLRDRLKEKRIKQSELANKVGVKPPQISRIISGEREPTNELLIKMGDVLRLPREIVFGAAGLMPPSPEEDEWDQRIKHLLRSFPLEEKEKIVKRLELEAQFYEQRPSTKSTNKTRA